MAAESKMLSLGEKIQLLAQDIYNAALLKNSLKLENFAPSKQVQNLLDEDEFDSLIEHLKKRGILTSLSREFSVREGGDASKNGYHTYKVVINQPKIRQLLGLKDIADKPAEEGIRLHPKYSYLIVDGKEIPLAKGKLHKTLQYWICCLCLKKPNIPVQETDIMAKYASDFHITGRSRAVRDAVYKLNPKIKKAAGVDELFTYSNGFVIFNADKLK